MDGEASTPKPFSSAPRSRPRDMDHMSTSHPKPWPWQNLHRLPFASNPSSNPARRSTLLDQHQTSFRPCRTPDQWSGSSGARRSRGETIFDDQHVDRTKPMFLINWTSYIPQDPDAVYHNCQKSIPINSPIVYSSPNGCNGPIATV